MAGEPDGGWEPQASRAGEVKRLLKLREDLLDQLAAERVEHTLVVAAMKAERAKIDVKTAEARRLLRIAVCLIDRDGEPSGSR